MRTVLLFVVMAAACFALFSGKFCSLRWQTGHASPQQRSAHNGFQTSTVEASQGIGDVPLLLELLAAASEAGMTLAGALRTISAISCPLIGGQLDRVVAGLEMGASWEHSWAGVQGLLEVEQLREALSFSAMTGAAAAPLLHKEAAQMRRQQQRAAEAKAAALGVKLVIPLGLCSLPAFVCLGIVPVVIAMIPTI